MISNPLHTVATTSDFFGIFSDKAADLITTGITPLDEEIGGIFPGFSLVLGAMTGVGKSNLVLRASLQNKMKVGIISLEDTPDIIGSRLLAMYSGINSRRLRLGSFSPHELARLKKAREQIGDIHNVLFNYCIGANLEQVLQATSDLADAGCQLIWLDYLHKIKGRGARKDDVSYAFSAFQNLCYEKRVASAVVAQFSRKTIWAGDHTRDATIYDTPRLNWLKDSGDIENESRIVLLAHKSPEDKSTMVVNVAKSTIGDIGRKIHYRYNENGALTEIMESDTPF